MFTILTLNYSSNNTENVYGIVIQILMAIEGTSKAQKLQNSAKPLIPHENYERYGSEYPST
jgi:hypothetical protein